MSQTLSGYPNFERYQKDNELIIQSKTYPKVIFIGNSITDGWASKRPDFFTDHQFLGRGISGQTSPQLLLRFQKDVIDLHPKLSLSISEQMILPKIRVNTALNTQ